MKRSVIANWKMHFTLKEAIEFCHAFPLSSPREREISRLIIAAPVLYLEHLTRLFPHLSFAAQDVSSHENYGAYTGEISADQLASCGISYCITGHPERRRDFGENDELVKRKAESCLNAGLVPIICLGGNMSLAKEFGEGVIVAYEPGESIGTGVVPGKERLAEVFGELKSMVAKSVNLVYGGSVNPENLPAIKEVNEIDGILLGGAALKTETLREILENW